MEATALICDSGHWSVILGPDRWLRRFVLDPDRHTHPTEDQLGLSALRLGSGLLRRFLQRDAHCHSVRVCLITTPHTDSGVPPQSPPSVRAVITAETEITTAEVSRWLTELLGPERTLDETPLAMRLDAVEINVRSPVRIPIF